VHRERDRDRQTGGQTSRLTEEENEALHKYTLGLSDLNTVVRK